MIKQEIVQNGPIIKRIPVFEEPIQKGKKAKRVENILNLTVTTKAGNIFDANEISQNIILKTIHILEWNNLIETDWKLADNTIKKISIEEFKEVLKLSLTAQSNLWIKQ